MPLIGHSYFAQTGHYHFAVTGKVFEEVAGKSDTDDIFTQITVDFGREFFGRLVENNAHTLFLSLYIRRRKVGGDATADVTDNVVDCLCLGKAY